MEGASLTTILLFAADLLIRIGFSIRVVMRRRPVGVTHAWLIVILFLPFAGAAIYLTFGELRLGSRSAEWAARIHKPFEEWLRELDRFQVDWSGLGAACEPLARLTQQAVGMPTLPGNALQLIGDWREALRSIIRDIDAARRTCHMEFYIWNEGGMADEVAEALLRAAERGVVCRVLVDDVGSRPFLRSELARRLREGGVRLRSALPAGLIRMLFVRLDLRMHRKIVVIDGEVAYTGSLNMVDPRYFKKEAGVGQWIDAMVRVRGPAVEGLAVTFLEDWELETREGLDQLRDTGDAHQLTPCGPSAVQVAPSGPVVRRDAVQDVLLMAIYAARRELVLTTPYFVPDESLVTALISAARRGVRVTLLVPEKVDSLLVRMASQAFKGDLLAAGVRVMLFHGGLLHTKSVTVDGEFSLFGSLNLDPRSLHLNFEITLAIYDAEFTAELRSLQASYQRRSRRMDFERWRSRSGLARFSENAARLVGPLL